MSESSDADAVASTTQRTGAVRAPAEEPTRVQEAASPTSVVAPTSAASVPEPTRPARSAATSTDPGTAGEPSKLQSLIAEKPELLLLGAFAGGLVLAIVIRRLGH